MMPPSWLYHEYLRCVGEKWTGVGTMVRVSNNSRFDGGFILWRERTCVNLIPLSYCLLICLQFCYTAVLFVFILLYRCHVALYFVFILLYRCLFGHTFVMYRVKNPSKIAHLRKPGALLGLWNVVVERK